MKEHRKSLSTKKPPIAINDHKIIKDWMDNRTMPGILPMIKKIDDLIGELIPNLHYAIKWGNAYYGTKDLGWLIEVAAYDVSVNIVFLNGAAFDPQPPMGTGEETRYVKLRTMNELEDQKLINFIMQAGRLNGWK